MPLKINVKNVLLYAIYTFLLICINRAVAGVPFSLGLCFAMLICGSNLIVTPVLYVLSTIVNLNLTVSLLSLFEGAFTCAVTLLYRRTHKKIRAEAAAYLLIALAPFIALSPWHGGDAFSFVTENDYLIRAVAAISVIAFGYFCFKTVYAALYRVYRCRLRGDELVCGAVVFTLFGVGLYRLIGEYACLCLGAGAVVFAVRLFRNPAAVIAALVLGLPVALSSLEPDYLTAFAVLSVVTLLFCGAGRGAPSAVALAACAVFAYFSGFFSCGVALIVFRVVALAACCLLPVLPSADALRRAYDLLTVRKLIPDAREERFRRRTAEKLYRLSEVFREIECAFVKLDETFDEQAMRERILEDFKERQCASCERREKCEKSRVYSGYAKLIEVGCIKGKVSLVDLPSDVTLCCAHPTESLAVVNRLLADFRRLTLEAENAKSGRKLLAGQAKGISEVLKDCAVGFSRPEERRGDLANALQRTLGEHGISCPEAEICGEENMQATVTLVGKSDLSAVREILTRVTGKDFILKDKLVFDDEKSCFTFISPPRYDAAFGVAFRVKDGECVSGDTHSVIKINEHSFLMALSDGMGSGEYARKVSATAISLIEAFYRAEMPEETVLDTINKLICFNRDERFTCIDIAAVDLNTLRANFIKIGSPAGIIVRQGEIKVLESRSLPLGILETLRPTVCAETLKGGDIVVFMSDGITSAFSSTTELYAFLQNLKPLNPQNLAEKILQGAVDNCPDGAVNDDMTVLCTRIFERVNE